MPWQWVSSMASGLQNILHQQTSNQSQKFPRQTFMASWSNPSSAGYREAYCVSVFQVIDQHCIFHITPVIVVNIHCTTTLPTLTDHHHMAHTCNVAASLPEYLLHHHNRFTALFPGPPGWAGGRRELLDLHFIWTNQCSPPPSSPYYLQARCPSCRQTNSVKAHHHKTTVSSADISVVICAIQAAMACCTAVNINVYNFYDPVSFGCYEENNAVTKTTCH